MTVKIKVDEILERLLRSGSGHFARPDETPETLRYFDINQVRHMELVLPEETSLDSGAKQSLEEKLQQGRCVDHDHADSRSSRMTTAAGVFRVTRFRL
jgi:hypothetical protein